MKLQISKNFSVVLISVASFLLLMLPTSFLLINKDQSYATMDEPRFVIEVQENGLFGGIAKTITFTTNASRANYFGVVLSDIVASVNSTPRFLRAFRVIECFLLIAIFALFISKFFGSSFSKAEGSIEISTFLLPCFLIVGYIAQDLPFFIFHSSVYELEASVFLVVLLIFVFSGEPRFLLVPILVLILCLIKEPLALVAGAICTIGLAYYFFNGRKIRIELLTGLALSIGALLYFITLRDTGYASNYSGSPLDRVSSFFEFILSTKSLVLTLLIAPVASVFNYFLLKKKSLLAQFTTIWMILIIPALISVVALLYAFVLYPWAGDNWPAYYYFPVRIMIKTALIIVLLPLFWVIVDTVKGRYNARNLGLVFLVLIGAYQVFHYNRDVFNLMEHSLDNRRVGNLIAKWHAQLNSIPYFYAHSNEVALRLNQSQRLLDHGVGFMFKNLSSLKMAEDCWNRNLCRFLVIEDYIFRPEYAQFDQTAGVLTVKTPFYLLFVKPSN